jgi:predicted nucleotidyltransferase
MLRAMMRIDEIRACVAPLLVAKGAKRAVIFGSIARGTDDGRSDIDLLVVDNEDLRYFARLDKYYDELVDLLHRPVDLFVYREAEMEVLRDRPFVRRALAEGKVIFE